MTVFADNRKTLEWYRRLTGAAHENAPPPALGSIKGAPHGPPGGRGAGSRAPIETPVAAHGAAHGSAGGGLAAASPAAVACMAGRQPPPSLQALLGSAAGGGITILIPGPPVPWSRATPSGGRMLTTRQSRAYGRVIAEAAALEMAGEPPVEGPVRVWATAHLPVPRSWSKAKQGRALSGLIRPTGRPDVDNYIKAAFDGLNEIVWRDDSQVVEVTVGKVYSDRPRLVITVAPA